MVAPAAPVKVLHVVHGYFPQSVGGAESYVRTIAHAQHDAGHQVVLVSGDMQPWEQCGLERFEEHGIQRYALHRDDQFFDHHAKAWHPGIDRLWRDLLARERPDLVHVHQWIRLTCTLIEIAEGLGLPTVLTLHDVLSTCPRAFRVDRDGQACTRPFGVASCLPCAPRYGHESDAELREGLELFGASLRNEIMRARRVLVCDASTAELVAKEQDLPPSRFAVLPLPHRPHFTARPRTPRGDRPLYLGYFGNLARHKGVAVLVEAFARLCAQGLPARAELHLFGKPETDAFAAELHTKAAGAPITFHGAYTPEALAGVELDVAVFPSLSFETFSFVLDEAFELGLPVVVSDLGALSRRAGTAAIRVPPGDVAAWQRALHDLIAAPGRLETLRQAIPAPPPPLEAHLAALLGHYAAARAAPPVANAPTVDAGRRAAFLLRQRESLQRRAGVGGPS